MNPGKGLNGIITDRRGLLKGISNGVLNAAINNIVVVIGDRTLDGDPNVLPHEPLFTTMNTSLRGDE